MIFGPGLAHGEYPITGVCGLFSRKGEKWALGSDEDQKDRLTSYEHMEYQASKAKFYITPLLHILSFVPT